MPSEQDNASEKPPLWLVFTLLAVGVALAAILHRQSLVIPVGLVSSAVLLILTLAVLAVEQSGVVDANITWVTT